MHPRMEDAYRAAIFAVCKRRQVGAVVHDVRGNLISAGANHLPHDVTSCVEGGCPRAESGVPGLVTPYVGGGPGECGALHAEEEAMLWAGWQGMVGGSMAVTCQPCPNCMRLIKASPLVWVAWPDGEWRRT